MGITLKLGSLVDRRKTVLPCRSRYVNNVVAQSSGSALTVGGDCRAILDRRRTYGIPPTVASSVYKQRFLSNWKRRVRSGAKMWRNR
ncbi:MAG: hypothetical protein K0Q46_1003 [Rhodococcus erythropolis]|jgi:hypothetical protein|nr:hypothetical protein [Rhodococcus erythropolis]